MGIIDERSRSGIDPNILKRMGDESARLPFAFAELKGTSKQVIWALSIRMAAFALVWPPEIQKKLASISDATWWIANKAIVETMKFKEPSPAQVVGCSTTGPAAESTADDEEPPERKASAAPSVSDAARKRVSDAAQWAKSVSVHPRLAEAAILAVLRRLYADKGNQAMATELSELANKALSEANDVIEKDANAIRFFLK